MALHIAPPPKVLYLPKEDWSPRYDSTFFTVKLEGKKILLEPPTDVPSSIGGKSNHPAYYYETVVYREHNKQTLLRRYSQFKWLYDQLRASPPTDDQNPNAQPIHMPPGTCPFQWQSDAFAQNRLEQLGEFINDVLARPGYASHPAVATFLELV
jgi:PX domain